MSCYCCFPSDTVNQHAWLIQCRETTMLCWSQPQPIDPDIPGVEISCSYRQIQLTVSTNLRQYSSAVMCEFTVFSLQQHTARFNSLELALMEVNHLNVSNIPQVSGHQFWAINSLRLYDSLQGSWKDCKSSPLTLNGDLVFQLRVDSEQGIEAEVKP